MDTAVSSGTALALRSIEIMAGGDFDDFTEVVHPLATNREGVDEPPDARGQGPRAFHATALWLRAAYADLNWQIHDTVERGDLVVVHCTMSGRHAGPFIAYDADARIERVFPPTGRTFATTQTHWLRLRDGKVIEHWANRDDLGTAAQLGWIPPTPLYLLRCALATRRARRSTSGA
ncbi:ester cyclase [Parafrankia sp. EUN1f]|uniref:ester cyclase n=1 Tax=Parafrankia sp. EUN1f TaxID=102897 RepID=UPI0001C4756E|nr:ester cyclase [Parafrankia sp. EUN1f]EFC79288.1 protein of unknown function DUF1486 [Parafrankia sp. EUN1f]